jgi:Serine endopeptidase inhibitors
MKKNTKDQVPREGNKPFFARLLEEQELEEVAGGARLRGESTPVTMKAPSDGDELPSS